VHTNVYHEGRRDTKNEKETEKKKKENKEKF
jgi:hypothetical protein